MFVTDTAYHHGLVLLTETHGVPLLNTVAVLGKFMALDTGHRKGNFSGRVREISAIAFELGGFFDNDILH